MTGKIQRHAIEAGFRDAEVQDAGVSNGRVTIDEPL
jgi:hypothetical protein